jgi:hypothetical protein
MAQRKREAEEAAALHEEKERRWDDGEVDEIEEVERMLMANDVTVHPDEEDEEVVRAALALEEGEGEEEEGIVMGRR